MAAEPDPQSPAQDPLSQCLTAQRQAFRTTPYPDANSRIARLDRLNNAILDHQKSLISAIESDFGTRPAAETLLAEIYPVLDAIAHARRNLRRWMRPERRRTPLLLWPAKTRVEYQPLGVVGIVAPWNFPLLLTLSPLVGALAAGNRAMIKSSEFVPATGAALREMLASVFPEDEVAVFTGDVDEARAFTSLPFDHLIFNGSTEVGRQVMRAAADNLTPVTLELGGKSPALIHTDFPMAEAAKRLAFGKSVNAGQACVAPDYILCPQGKIEEFATAFLTANHQNYPTTESFTSIINETQMRRLQELLEDARNWGATLLSTDSDASAEPGKMPMTLVLGATDHMRVMREEVFGPILPVIPYKDLDDALEIITDRPHPLAFYYFDWNQTRAREVLSRCLSGGACVNDSMAHVTVDQLPFGGVGASGYGRYHGRESFRSLSNARGVLQRGRINLTPMIGPPWNNRFFRMLVKLQKRRYRKR